MATTTRFATGSVINPAVLPIDYTGTGSSTSLLSLSTDSEAAEASKIFALPTMISATNAGPMTTPAVLPSDCLSALWDFQMDGLWPYNPSRWTYFTQGCAVSTCCPGSQKPFSTAYQWLSTYNSPGVCPVNWRECPGPAVVTSSTSETVAFCCPSNLF